MNLEKLSDVDLLQHVKEQEHRIVFSSFSAALAREIGQALVAKAEASKAPIAIDVTRTGQCLFHCAMEGAVPDNAEWILRKNRVVNRFRHSSLYMGTLCRSSNSTLEEKFLLPINEYAPHGGAFPITLDGAGVIGTVTVSGLPQIDDHEMVVSVLETFIDK